MKRILSFVFVLLLVFPLCASTFMGDISLRIGHGSFVAHDGDYGLSVLGGASFGLTERLELNVEAITEITPSPLSEVAAGFEIGYSLLGNRTNESGNAGFYMNTIISAGLFAADHSGNFAPTYLTLRITPISMGTPNAGYRQSLVPVGLAWNFRENTFSLFLSLTIYDHYIKGSWRDYR
ncbi:MAG: hypothetical protein K6F82_00385 [Sphaerochaetaceae bacterium]|nr:hypothetical protein [Sphaerochaetaceae bacterium]